MQRCKQDTARATAMTHRESMSTFYISDAFGVFCAGRTQAIRECLPWQARSTQRRFRIQKIMRFHADDMWKPLKIIKWHLHRQRINPTILHSHLLRAWEKHQIRSLPLCQHAHSHLRFLLAPRRTPRLITPKQNHRHIPRGESITLRHKRKITDQYGPPNLPLLFQRGIVWRAAEGGILIEEFPIPCKFGRGSNF